MSRPLVSVCVITYNQVNFVGEALDGVLAQKRESFDLEIVVGDDYSTDGTPSLIAKYADKHPELFRVCNRSSNLGMHRNWEQTILDCKGDYIAILEGDDKWIDPYKLEKQLNLLLENSDASACFSNAKVLLSSGEFDQYNYVDRYGKDQTIESFLSLNLNPVPTCTLLFKKRSFNGFPAEYYQSPFADWILHSLLIQQGKYVYLNSCTSAYRQHSAGVWSGINAEKQLTNKSKALWVISQTVNSELQPTVLKAVKLQLHDLLYFYREQGKKWKYFVTWLRLKFS